jgi:hypothetical protein
MAPPSAGAAGAAASGAGAGAASGAGAGAAASGAGAAASSFLPQAVKEMANRAASRTEYFIYIPLTKNGLTLTPNRPRTLISNRRADSSKTAKENQYRLIF